MTRVAEPQPVAAPPVPEPDAPRREALDRPQLGRGLAPAQVLALQRTAGNAATARLLRDPAPVDQSLAVNGLPALRYNLPNIPVSEAWVETPAATIHAELLLRGNLTAVLNEPLPGGSLDQGGWRQEVTNQINGIGGGVRISGLPNNPSIGATEGNRFELFESRFTPPNIASFIGQARIAMPPIKTQAGVVRVTGQPGCELRMTIYPKLQRQTVPEPAPEPQTSPVGDWWTEHAGEVGVFALAALAIGGLLVVTVLTEGAAAPATGPAIAEEVAVLGGAAAAMAQ